MNVTVYMILRLGVGVSMFGHGLVRLPKLGAFSEWMTTTFEKSFLPYSLVKPFSYALPVLEFGVGIFILAGLFTKPSLILASILLLMLLLGTCMLENWEAIPSQLIHLAFFALLIQFTNDNVYSLDKLLKL